MHGTLQLTMNNHSWKLYLSWTVWISDSHVAQVLRTILYFATWSPF